jgi:hypothetical protein
MENPSAYSRNSFEKSSGRFESSCILSVLYDFNLGKINSFSCPCKIKGKEKIKIKINFHILKLSLKMKYYVIKKKPVKTVLLDESNIYMK